MTKNEAAAVAQDDIDIAASAADQDNPFKVAGDNVPLPEDTNVIEIDSRRGIPADRLPTEGVFKLPSRKSLYHTERAEAARDRAAQEMLDLNQTMQLLIKAGLKRNNVKYPDVADHNAATLAYALKYAANGLHVIDSHAIDPKTGVGTGPQGDAKRPRGAKWQERASNDPETIKAFWTGAGNYPKNKDGETYRYARVSAPRNVSIAFPEACGMFVLDIDGDDGKRALAALETEHGSLPVTAKSITGSGGWHFIFRTGRPIRNTASQIAPGVDIRGEGGQIIAPPSIHKTGNFYQWEVAPGDGIADAPEWLVDLAFSATKANAAKDSKGHAHKATGTANPRTGQSYDSHGFEAILDTIGDHADGNGFDTPIYRAACSWFSANGADIDVTDLQEVLREVILAAECDDARAETRYATDDYLSERIEQARAFILSARPEDSTAEEDMTPDTLAGDLGDASKTPDERAEGFTTQHSEAEIRTFMKALHEEGVDKVVRGNVTTIIAKQTSLSKPDIKGVWRELDADKKRREREVGKSNAGNYILTTDPAPEQTQYAIDAIKAENDREPFLFEYMEQAAIVRKGRIKTLDHYGRKNAVGDVTAFHRPRGEGETQHVYPPDEVINDVFANDLSNFLLPLRGSVDTPFFAADGTLVTQNGYHAGSQVVMQTEMVLDRVSDVPSDAEVQAARKLIVENVLADFPLDGMSRAEIIASLDGDAIPAVTHAIGLCLLPFMREMIDGPTPGWAFVKPAPGTGASLLVKLLTTIASGTSAPETALPPRTEEVGKTLTSILQNGPMHIVFDNVDKAVKSPELASAMTARTYQARILGKSQTVSVDVRSIFVFTANNLEANKDIIRRSVFIPLDAKMDDPETREGFLHKYVEKWVSDHRSELVHACLTVIQNWIAKGMQRSQHRMASYEDWAAVTGGVLDAANISGFLEGQTDARAQAADAAQNEVRQFMDILADYPNESVLRPGGKAKFQDTHTVSIQNILNGELRAQKEVGDDNPDPIQLNGWGYDSYDGTYKSASKIKSQFDKLARKPHRGGDYVLTFEALADTKNKTTVYRMTKERVKA